MSGIEGQKKHSADLGKRAFFKNPVLITRGGEFARGMEQGREAAVALLERIQGGSRFLTAFTLELDIMIEAPVAAEASEISA